MPSWMEASEGRCRRSVQTPCDLRWALRLPIDRVVDEGRRRVDHVNYPRLAQRERKVDVPSYGNSRVVCQAGPCKCTPVQTLAISRRGSVGWKLYCQIGLATWHSSSVGSDRAR